MSEAAITGAVVQALEPFAAQALEDLHAYLSSEITRLEAEMPDAIDRADAAVKYYVGDLKTVLHKFVAKLDETRGGASTAPTDAAPPTQPSGSTPADSSASPTPAASPTPSQPTATPAASPAATATSSASSTAAPADGKPSA